MKARISLLAVLAAFVLGLVPCGYAQSGAALSAEAPPDENVAIGYSGTVNGGYSWGQAGTAANRHVGQTFTTKESFVLDAFTLQIAGNLWSGQRIALEGASFEVLLLTVGKGTTNVIGSQTLGTGSLASPLPATTQGLYLTFDVPDTALAAQTTYGIVLRFLNPQADRYLPFNMKYGGDSAVGGNAISSTDGGATWSSTNNEFIFFVQSTVAASIIGTVPNENIAISYTQTVNGNFAWGRVGPSVNRDVGQTFTTKEGFILDKFTLQIAGNLWSGQRVALEGARFEVQLLTLEAGAFNVLGSRPLGTGRLPASLPSATLDSYLSFDLPDTELAAHTTYGIVLRFIDSQTNRYLSFKIKYGGDSAVGGNAIASTDGGTTWTNTNNEFIFFVQSAFTTSIGAAAPAENVAISHTQTADGNFSWGQAGTSANRDIGQTFTTDEGFILDTFTLQINSSLWSGQRDALQNARFEVRLLTYETGTTNLIASQSLGIGRLASSLSTGTAGLYLGIDVPDIKLAADTTYGIVLSFLDPQANRYLSFKIKYGVDSSVGGSAIVSTDGGATWTNTYNEFIFYIQRAPAVTGDAYVWKPMKIGGGGWVTGLHISPTEPDLVYARTDVSGAYRWDAEAALWRQVVTTSSMPAGVLSYGNYGGVDSLVSASSDPDIAYMAFAAKPYGGAYGQIYKSTNRGQTWISTTLLQHQVWMEPDGEGRQEGERLAVDPVNSNVVYFGSLSDGLWTTVDGGTNWTRVTAIPSGLSGHGVNTVVFGPACGVAQTKTNLIYVTVMGNDAEGGGVYRTSDTGLNWTRISRVANGPVTAGKPRDAAIGSDHTYYVAYDNEGGAIGSIWKYSPAGSWTEITPPLPEGGSKTWWAVTVSPTNPDLVVAMIHGGTCFVSEDQGATWSHHGFHINSSDIPWQEEQTNYFLSVGELELDPFEPGRLWFAQGLGVTRATIPTTASNIEWYSISEGIEETCGNDVIAPPGGNPVGAMWDLGGVYFTDLNAYGGQRSHTDFMSAWSLDWCAADPSFVAGVFRSHIEVGAHPRSSGYSTDGGRTWTRFASLQNNTTPSDLEYGVIAVSADSPDNIVWAPTLGKLPYYTTDRGATWIPSTLVGATTLQTGHHAFYVKQKLLCADRVAPGTFYLYTPYDGLFRSTDGGATFIKVGAGKPLANRWDFTLKSTPGHAGHLWYADGGGVGAWRSTDGGATWTGVPEIQQAYGIGLGKPRTTGGYPTLFVAGVKSGQRGIYRSINEGQTWEKLIDWPLGITDWVGAIDGDKNVFGRVYIAFACSGFAYGAVTGLQPAPLPGSQAATLSNPTPTAAEEPGNTVVSDDTTDSDGDGLANLMEYALGLDPLVADSTGAPQVILNQKAGGQRLSITFNRIADPFLTYIVEATDDLSSDDWDVIFVSTGEENIAGLVTVEDPEFITDHVCRFLRLVVIRADGVSVVTVADKPRGVFDPGSRLVADSRCAVAVPGASP